MALNIKTQSRLDSVLDDVWTELTSPGSPYEMVSVDVRGETLRQYVKAPTDMRAVWNATTSLGSRDYLVFERERLTYSQAHFITNAIATWLVRHGLKTGDRVAIAMRNFPEWLLVYWACLSRGIVVVGINAWSVSTEIAHVLKDAAPKVVFCDVERLERLAAEPAAAAGLLCVLVRAKPPEGIFSWSDVIAQSEELEEAPIGADDDACIFYTSGTTGSAKGALMSHRGCVNNFMNVAFATEAHALAAGRVMPVQGSPAATSVPVGLVTTPLFHVTANNCLTHPVTAAGGTLVLMRKWDAQEALRLVEVERVSILSGVPTMAREFIQHPSAGAHDLSSLTVITGGGAQVPPDLVEKIAARDLPAKPSTGYGMTETCGVIAAIAGPFFVNRPESCGRIMPTLDVRIVDEAAQMVPAGAVGELCVRGASVIKGYINRPEATADTIVDGWLHTGDLARLDEQGYVYIVDRKKDMVLRGGENVFCAEVEAALFRHPAVIEACVFGVEDDRLGEEVGAAIVLQPGIAVTAEEIRRHLAPFLASYKVPRYVWLLSEQLPRNASGKFMRRELRAALPISTAR